MVRRVPLRNRTLAEVIEPPPLKARLAILGANGSGKSLFTYKLLQARKGSDYCYKRQVIIDPKGDFGLREEPQDSGNYIPIDPETYKLYAVVDTPPNLSFWKSPRNWWAWRNADRVLYRPKPPYHAGQWIDYVIGWLFMRARKTGKKKPFLLVLDEGLLQGRTRKTEWYGAIIVAGRSMGVGVWTLSQRLSWIPVEVKSEAWILYVFFLSSIQEEREVINYTKGRLTVDQLEAGTADYSFWEIKTRGKGGAITVRHLPPLALNGPTSQPSGTPRTTPALAAH